MFTLTTALLGLGAVIAMMCVVWGFSVRLRDAGIVDRVWGLCFVVLALCYFSQSANVDARKVILAIFVCVWGVRLSLHIHLRNRGHAEDYRYAAMRAEHGQRFWWYSFFSVFLLQAIIAWIVALPFLYVFSAPPIPFGVFDVLGVVLFCTGFLFEALGDYQLVVFKRDPANRGKLLTRGLWALTRHPNYFGDAVLWWGLFAFALAVPYGYLSVIGPIVMTLLIRYVSGVSLLEKNLQNVKPGYEDYVRNTPAFVPRLWPKTH